MRPLEQLAVEVAFHRRRRMREDLFGGRIDVGMAAGML